MKNSDLFLETQEDVMTLGLCGATDVLAGIPGCLLPPGGDQPADDILAFPPQRPCLIQSRFLKNRCLKPSVITSQISKDRGKNPTS